MAQHHFGGQDQRARVHLVLASVLRRGAVSCFEHSNGIGQVGTRSDANTAHFGRQSIGQVVTIEVQGGNYVVFGRTQQDLLQHGVGDGVLDDDVLAGFRVLELHPRTAVEQGRAELFSRHFVGPFLEGTFGELHDVAFVHDGQRVAVVVDHILQGLARQTLSAFLGNRLDADTAVLVETDLGNPHFFLEELDDLVRFRRAGFPLDAGINIFGILPEDGHVDVAGLLHRAGHAFEPAHRAQADVQIQLLAQGYVEGADATTDRRGQRPLDGDDVILDRIQGFLRQPGVLVIHLGGFLAGVNFHPGNLALAAVGFFDGCIDDLDHHRADIDADAVTLDVRDDRVVRYVKRHIGIDGDFVTGCWHLDLLVSHAGLRFVVRNHISPERNPLESGETTCSFVYRRLANLTPFHYGKTGFGHFFIT
ncbi:hypothetical protein D3C84_399800 [compost metagenome]